MTSRADRITEAVIDRLRRIRLEQGVSLRQLGLKADLDRTHLGKLEKGHRRPALEVALQWAEALGVSLSDLLHEAEASAKPSPKASKRNAPPSTEKANVGTSIRRARFTAGLTQEQLARKAKLGKKDIALIEQNAVSPSVDVFLRICKALDVKAGDLLG